MSKAKRKKRKLISCCVCDSKNPQPVIFMGGNRFCDRCARFTLNFSHSLAKELSLSLSDK